MSDFDHEGSVVVTKDPRYRIDREGRLWDTVTQSCAYTAVNRGSAGYLLVWLKGVKKRFQVHQLVAAAFLPPRPLGPPRYEIDHIDLHRDNPRADNLRWGTRSQNIMNGTGWGDRRVLKLPKNIHKKCNKFIIQIRKNGKCHWFGGYLTLESAVEDAKRLRRELHGEFARDG